MQRVRSPGMSWLIVSLICGALAVVPPAQADPTGETDGPPPGVLVIESFNQTFPWTVQFEQGLVRAQQQAGADTPIYFEYLDSARFPSDGKAFRAYLDAKYADANVGAIVAESLPAVTWAQDNPGFLPTATRIYVDSDPPPGKGSGTEEAADSPTSTSGAKESDAPAIRIGVDPDMAASIKEMRRLSGANKVHVVADSLTPVGAAWLSVLRESLERSAPDLSVEEHVDLPMAELERVLAEIPADEPIYYLPIFQDGDGTSFVPLLVLKRLAGASDAPILSNWSTLIGHGVVGGHTVSVPRIGEETWGVVESVLAGRNADSELMIDALDFTYDHRELVQHGLDHVAIPDSAELAFYEPPPLERYKTALILTGVAFIVLLGFTIALWVARQRIKTANVELHDHREHLQEKVDRQTDSLRRMNRDLADSNEELNRFAYVASHDLQAPLRRIGANSEYAAVELEGGDVESARESLDCVAQDVSKMRHFIQSLLKHSRIPGEMPTEPGTRLLPVIEAAAGQLVTEIESVEGSIRIDCPETLTVNGDPTLLSAAFQNLIDNAIRYRAMDRSLQIRISAEQAGPDVDVTVEDTGVGMSEDIQDRVFDMFFTTSADAGGTGIGLASVRKTIERHGGRISFTSEPDVGTTFHITLHAAT